MDDVKPVHRYKAQTMFSFGGAKIEYFPHGPEVVLATEFDAQRLRADTAEAENKLLRHQLAASAQELRKASSWICREVEAGTTSATHWAIRLSTNADQIDAAAELESGRKPTEWHDVAGDADV